MTGSAALAGLGLLAVAAYVGQRFVLHDDRFLIPSSAAIQIEGNHHLTRAQLLSVFGEDVERNIFRVSLAERRAQLEQLPWVEHATVMRLLPDRLRIAVVERTPVAFVRQGRRIGLVDKNGVLLDFAAQDADQTAQGPGEQYSFPVVTGITDEEPLSVRAARMKIYQRFSAELDRSGEKISGKMSEVDLSNPEDVKAVIPNDGTEILVHFGDSEFLDRYRKFQEQLPGWRTQYPKLASADMRYERQVVLEMQAGAAVPVPAGTEVEGKAPEKKVAARKTLIKKAVQPALNKALAGLGQPHFPVSGSAIRP